MLLASFIWVPGGPALALDEGGGNVGLAYYALRFRTLGQQFSLSEALWYADLHQRLTNYGLLEARGAFSDLGEPQGSGEPSGWRQAYGRLSLKDYRWGRAVLATSVGDQNFQLTALPLRFSNYFYPTNYFRGLSFQVSHPYLQMEVLGGRVTISKGLLGETFTGIGEDLYGFLARSQPWERLLLEGNFFSTQNEKDYVGNLVTRNNQVFRVASQLRLWSQLYVLGEFMQSYAEDPNYRKTQDLAYRAGPIWKGERLHLEGNYRYLGPRFHLINQIYQPEQNIQGYFVSGDFRPWPFLGISGSYDTSHNNLVTEPTSSINETESRSLGIRFYRTPWPILYWRYYSSNIATRGDFPVAVRGSTQAQYVEVSKRFGFLETYGRYERFQYRDEISQSTSYLKNSPLLGVRGYHAKVIWYGEGEYDTFSPASQGQGFDGLYLKIGGSYNFSPSLFIYGEGTYRPNSQRYGGQIGLNWQLPLRFSLQVFGRAETGRTGAGDFINNYSTNTVMVRLTKAFSWGKKTEVTGLKAGQEWLGTGSIEGWVFNDANFNGTLDSGEQGVAGIKVTLEDGSTVITDKNGRYQFPAVGAGKHIVSLDARRIPAVYTFLGSETMGVQVQRRGKSRVDFPFARGASIQGRVLSDPKGTGKAAPDAQGVADVLVILKPGDLNTYTDSEGNFSFEGVIPKKYEISLDPQTLPEYSRLTTPTTLQADLSAGGKVKRLQFLVNIGERRIIFQ
ncbi:MAG: SdrD B-like domain-containing protein [Thermodesulfobacteriota bacterium]